MINAQEWLDEKYAKKDRKNIEELVVPKKHEKYALEEIEETLEGILNLKGFIDLKKLDCRGHKISGLNLSDCNVLEVLNCSRNELTDLDFKLPYPSKLTQLGIISNNLSGLDFSIFSPFTDLEVLWIGNADKEAQGNFNHFVGSLGDLKNLAKLNSLHLSNLNLTGEVNLESLNSLVKIYNVGNSQLKLKNVPEGTRVIEYTYSTPQYWLEKAYPNKQEVEIIEFPSNIEFEQAGELIIDDHLQLKKIKKEKAQESIRNVISVKVDDCPQLEEINIDNFWDNQKIEINNCLNLKSLECAWNELTNLDLSSFPSLEKLDLTGNEITSVDFLDTLLNPEKLEWLLIGNNNIKKTNLEFLKPFISIVALVLGNNNEEKIKQNKCNRFCGSLEILREMKNLGYLHISNTDIDSGIEHLLNDIVDRIEIDCSFQRRPESKVRTISEQLNHFFECEWAKGDFDSKQFKEWIKLGLKPNERTFATYLRNRGCNPSQENLNLDELREEYNKGQGWLDGEYPKEKRSEIKEIHLNEPSLEGELDLSDFTYYEHEISVKVYIYPQVDETKLVFKNRGKNIKIIPVIAQRYINYHYPTRGEKEELTNLNIRLNSLEGDLDLSNFVNLKELNCQINELTSLNLSNCSQLEQITCSDNLLTNLILPNNPTNLKELHLNNNNFPAQDLSFLSPYTNLEGLDLGNGRYNRGKEKIEQGIYNKFTGSLDYLSGMKQLMWLIVNNTDLNKVNTDKLPRNLEKIYCSTKERPNCKLTKIVSQLEKVSHGWCPNCQLPNTSEKWCHPCAEKKWKKDIENLTGQEVVEKFIQQQKLRESSKKLGAKNKHELKWIPYEQFTDIEYLAKGGFSEIYKAKWQGRESEKMNRKWERERRNYTDVALKVLTNSQNITLEFLEEVANIKLVDNEFKNIVPCYGISQDLETKDYVIVSAYIEGGNLREFLKNKVGELNFGDKLERLLNIAEGLKNIHEQGLFHRDLHSGNILNGNMNIEENSYITDMGLSQPAYYYQKEEGKIYGVLPYVAPEVLRGKPYTQAADIYSFGIVTYELLANVYPYSDLDDLDLTLSICQGLRPNLDELKIPQLLKDLIKRCWDVDPEKRPNAEKLEEIIEGWTDEEVMEFTDNEFSRQRQEIEEGYNNWSRNFSYTPPLVAVTTSKPINTQQIAELVKKYQKEQVASPSVKIVEQTNLEKMLEKIIEKIGKSLGDKTKELAKRFIKANQKAARDLEDKTLESEASVKDAKNWRKKLKEELKEANFSKEDRKKIITHCEDYKADETEKIIEKEEFQTRTELPPKKINYSIMS